MKYSRQERLSIGREVYEKRLGIDEAAQRYSVNKYTIRDYYREYKTKIEAESEPGKPKWKYERLSKDELINEIMSLKVRLLLAEGKKPVEVVHILKSEFPVSLLCEQAGITRAWYYKWAKS